MRFFAGLALLALVAPIHAARIDARSSVAGPAITDERVLTIQGAGNTKVNGLLAVIGEHRGRPKYSLVDNPKLLIYWSNSDKQWRMVWDNFLGWRRTTIYSNNEDTDVLPLDGWKVKDTKNAPVPRVIVTTPMDIRLLTSTGAGDPRFNGRLIVTGNHRGRPTYAFEDDPWKIIFYSESQGRWRMVVDNIFSWNRYTTYGNFADSETLPLTGWVAQEEDDEPAPEIKSEAIVVNPIARDGGEQHIEDTDFKPPVPKGELDRLEIRPGQEQLDQEESDDAIKGDNSPFGSCSADGPDEMHTSWIVRKSECSQLCGPSVSIDGIGQQTYARKFADAFDVSFSDGKCQCSVNGKALVVFKPRKGQAKMCEEGTGREVRDDCFRMYMKARGTRYETQGSLKIPIYKVPFSGKNFKVKRSCGTSCEAKEGGATCDINLPGPLTGMDQSDLEELGKAIDELYNGNLDDRTGAIEDLIAILPQEEIDHVLQVAGVTPSPTPSPTAETVQQEETIEVSDAYSEGSGYQEETLSDFGDFESEYAEDDFDLGALDFLGNIDEKMKEKLTDMLKDKSKLLKPTELNRKWCKGLRTGGRGCEPGDDSGKTCRCKFLGKEPMTCKRLFKKENGVFTVFKNDKLAIFPAKRCHCKGDSVFPVETQCMLGVKA